MTDWRKRVVRVARGAVFVALVYGAVMFAGQRLLVFPTWVVRRTPAPAETATLERWTQHTSEGDVEAWLVTASAQPAPAMVFFHGNGERTDDWLPRLESFRARGWHVLLVEYRGYNRSAGSASRDALVADSLEFTQRLARDPRVDASRIVFLGRSLGGAVATEVAAQQAPCALVLQSTFTSIAAMARRRALPAFLVRDPFDSEALLRTLHVPVFIAHGEHDPVIPFEQGVALARAAHGMLLTLDCAHNDCPPEWTDWVDEVLEFVGGACAGGSVRDGG